MRANLTTGGLISQPPPVRPFDQNRFVDRNQFKPRAILRQNLKALMDSRKGPISQSGLRAKSKVAQATIGRILSERGENAKMETVERIAKAYGLEGWQLLVAGMDPLNPPVLQPVSPAERALYERLRATVQDIAKLKP